MHDGGCTGLWESWDVLSEQAGAAASDVNAPPRLGFLLRLFLLRLFVGIHLDAAEGGGACPGRAAPPLVACSLWRRARGRPAFGCFGLALLQRPLHPDGAPLQFAAVQLQSQLDGVRALPGRGSGPLEDTLWLSAAPCLSGRLPRLQR